MNLAKKLRFAIITIILLTFSITPVNAAGKSGTPQQLILISVANQDGWVLESSENSSMGSSLDKTSRFLYLGDDNKKKEYRSILSFRTGELPDNATITKAILKVKQYGTVGNGNPVSVFHGFVVDIVLGHFSTYATLQISDFQAPANATYGPVSPVMVKKVYSFDLHDIKSFINKRSVESGLTQIRLGFTFDDNNDDFANILMLHSSNAWLEMDRPQLVITYTIP